ncbi:glucose-1-phosphate adenylyltransferase family protein [Oryzobacter sp. R7]|uniref:glucose-1-phosphate adenylyltransferase family protein n=1 Tax=Oryzobacter faecalis TaxID=3388656 RepID=UPI00398D22CD
MRSSSKVLAVVQAGGHGSRMDVLTRERAKPTLPFGGCYQLVDIALSNLVNSGIDDVWLSVQYQAGSLHRHLASGRPWDLDRTRGGLRWLMPAEGGGSRAVDGFSAGNADDLHQYADAVLRFGADAVVVLSTDQVFALDLRPVVEQHLERGSDCTVVTTEVTPTRAAQKDVVTVGRGQRVTAVEHKPDEPSGTTIAAEVFVFDPKVLVRTLDELRRELAPTDEDGTTGLGDYGEHLVPRLVRDGAVHVFPLDGYWADLGTPAAYLAAHRDLLAGRVDALGRPGWPVHTRWPEQPAARIDAGAVVEDPLVSPGCRVRGTVRRSVIGPAVVIEPGAVVEDAVLFSGVVVGRDARGTTAVLDERVRVEDGARVGAATRATRPHDDHIAVVARDSVIGRGVVIEPGARLEPGTTA